MAQAYQERPRSDIALEQRVYVPTERRMGLTSSGSEQESALVPTTKRLAPEWREVLGWDVLDNGLRPTSHTTAGFKAPVNLLVRAFANLRRFSLFVFWLFGGVRHFASRQKIHPDLESESESIEEVQTERLAAIGEILDNVAEGCDILAFLSGNGLFWRAIGLRRRPQGWIQRRRLGLERVGVFVGLASFVMESLVLSRRKKQLLSSYAQSERSMQLEMETFDASPKENIEDNQLNITSQTDCRPPDHQETSPITVLEESQLQISSIERRLHWLRIERICINADLSFGIYEACAPDKDKVVFEAGMGSLAAFLRLLRLWNEARFGTLDL